MIKPTILVIVGASGSGKTHIARYLEQQHRIPAIVSCTTRPARDEEQHGIDYYFVQNLANYDQCEKLTETSFGGYNYFALYWEVPPQGFCTYIVDEHGARKLKARNDERFDVRTILIRCSERDLRQRGISADRIERDKQRTALPESFFNHIINNDSTLANLEAEVEQLIQQLSDGSTKN